MIELLISLTGIVFGIILAKISPEEMLPGEKYFILIKRVLFILTSVVIFYFTELIFAIPFVILAVVLFVLDLKLKIKWLEIGNYIIFIVPYFFHFRPELLASLIFLYGLPAGTLLWPKRKT